MSQENVELFRAAIEDFRAGSGESWEGSLARADEIMDPAITVFAASGSSFSGTRLDGSLINFTSTGGNVVASLSTSGNVVEAAQVIAVSSNGQVLSVSASAEVGDPAGDCQHRIGSPPFGLALNLLQTLEAAGLRE